MQTHYCQFSGNEIAKMRLLAKTMQLRPHFDEIDRRILREITQDARLGDTVLAARAGLSPSPCPRRMQDLQRRGVMRGLWTRPRWGCGLSPV